MMVLIACEFSGPINGVHFKRGCVMYGIRKVYSEAVAAGLMKGLPPERAQEDAWKDLEAYIHKDILAKLPSNRAENYVARLVLQDTALVQELNLHATSDSDAVFKAVLAADDAVDMTGKKLGSLVTLVHVRTADGSRYPYQSQVVQFPYDMKRGR